MNSKLLAASAIAIALCGTSITASAANYDCLRSKNGGASVCYNPSSVRVDGNTITFYTKELNIEVNCSNQTYSAQIDGDTMRSMFDADSLPAQLCNNRSQLRKKTY